MKMFSQWGYQKNNRKSRAVRREGGSSGGVKKQPSGAELNIWETDTKFNVPTYKINGKTHFPLIPSIVCANPTQDEGITHRTEVLLQGSATAEVTVEPVASHQATSGVSSPLDEFRDANDVLNNYPPLNSI